MKTCITVKPVWTKLDKTKILLTNGSSMKIKSIAECSKGSILPLEHSAIHVLWTALSENRSWKPILVFFFEWLLNTSFTVLWFFAHCMLFCLMLILFFFKINFKKTTTGIPIECLTFFSGSEADPASCLAWSGPNCLSADDTSRLRVNPYSIVTPAFWCLWKYYGKCSFFP